MIKKVKYVLNRIVLYVLKVINTCIYILYPTQGKIVINGFFNNLLGYTKKNNFGDDLNFYILSAISGKKVFSAPNLLGRYSNILFIGSILQEYINRDSIVWGAGVIMDNYLLTTKPKIVKAVRGPLTRKWLIKNNINCPEIYADPVLLMPILYKPKVEKIYKYGIIPHYVDWNTNAVKCLCQKLGCSDIHLIDMRNYRRYETLIDEINQCEHIISSSLHGIILSDAYNIPNVWVEFSDNVFGEGFKFQDYFLSVNRINETPLRINETVNVKDVERKFSEYQKPEIDLVPFLKNTPIYLPDSLIKDAEDYYNN